MSLARGAPAVSAALTGRTRAGAISRPHYHANCESSLYMLRGEMLIRCGENFEEEIKVVPGDLLYVPPHETHILENLSETETIEYVVARNAATEDSVEVPWPGRETMPG